MNLFFTALFTVATFLGYAVPGFIMTKTGYIKGEHIASFSKVLMYICSPCLAASTIFRADLGTESLINIGLFALDITIVFLAMMAGYFFIMKKKSTDEVRYRVGNVACCFSNCAFFGVPVIENLFPDRPHLVVYTAVFSLLMNMAGWTVGSALITRDTKYIKPMNIILNPVLFGFIFGVLVNLAPFELPVRIADMVNLLGKMTTPMCMLILGMRLGTSRIRDVFSSVFGYAVVCVNQFVFPLLAYGVALLLPGDVYMKYTVLILCSCPVASVVLNFSELVGAGQKEAANMVLLGTLSSIITMPIMTLLIPA